MKKIGIIEDSCGKSAKAFLEKLIESGENPLDCEVVLIPAKIYPESFDIIILNTITPDESLERKLLSLKENGILILNSDDKNMPVLRLKKPIRLITCGFNPKSSFTASSVSHGDYTEVQCCIQRGFYTVESQYVEPREFSVISEFQNLGVNMILNCAAAALLAGAQNFDSLKKAKASL